MDHTDAHDPAPGAREAYYRELARDYEGLIRQLVPDYEEVMERLVELATLGEPGSLLDIGCGTGELTARLALAVPGMRTVALELSEEMASAARDRAARLESRLEVLELDVLDLEPGDANLPDESFDVVHSNFVLHNLPGPRKRRAVETAHRLLTPGGRLVWGDLIRFEDPRLQQAQVERRVRHARATGCPEELIEWNFRKEAQEDFPLTAAETLDLCREVGFPHPEVAWARDTFLMAWAAKKGPAPS